MGVTGSMTVKADIQPCFSTFTTWEKNAVDEMYYRSQYELADKFALDNHAFELLIGLQSSSENVAEILKMRKYSREVFKLFETRKGICDKYEVLCAITFLSALSSEAKVELLFELFNFNKKGYLLPNEIRLLLLSAIKAAKTVDRLLNIIDVSPAIEGLVKIAVEKYAHIDPKKSIRKPEFILFTKESRKVESFLDVWRGRIGHVVIPDNTLWDDIHFDADDSSIVPSKQLLLHGLPPKGFIHWIRLSEIRAAAGVIGRNTLFNSTLELSRIVKSRGYLTGSGAFARGYLKQGLIADRYLLNGIAVCLSSPSVIQGMFTATKQEALGRYCVKIFEGGAWRSIFVDSRIPCTPSGVPSFCDSSDPFECWPLLLEKGFAKYFGSYGHLAVNSSRVDASLTVLRLMTGGHVYRLCTYNLIWKSGYITRPDKDGIGMLQSLLAEGSLVAFGRSEVLALGKRPVRDTPQELCPHGRMFPVVGITLPDAECSYAYIVLKDSWNLIASDDASQPPDEESGYFRTFKVKLEEIPLLFDSLIVCRYPDVLRSERLAAYEIKKKMKMPVKPVKPNTNTNSSSSSGSNNNSSSSSSSGGSGAAYKPIGLPWQTEISRNKTLGTLDPARFRLVIKDDDSAFERDLGLDPEESEKSLSLPFGATLGSGSGVDNMLVDIAITVSSSFDWVVSGADDVGSTVTLRIVPSRRTLDRTILRKKQLKMRKEYAVEKQLRIEAKIMEELREQERNENEASRLDSEKEKNLFSVSEKEMSLRQENAEKEGEKKDDKKEEKTRGKSLDDLLIDKKNTPDPIPSSDSPTPFLSTLLKNRSEKVKSIEPIVTSVEDKNDPQGPEDGVYSFGAEGSWISIPPLFLYPGEYDVYADVSFKASTDTLRSRLRSPLDVKNVPWIEDILYGTPAVWLQCTSNMDRIDLSEGVGPVKPVLMVSEKSVESYVSGNTVDSDYVDGVGVSASQTPSESRKTSSDTRNNTNNNRRENINVNNNYNNDDLGDTSHTDLSTIIIPPSTWPFTTEKQEETASAGLYSMLSDLRGEAEELAADFISAARRFITVKKMMG